MSILYVDIYNNDYKVCASFESLGPIDEFFCSDSFMDDYKFRISGTPAKYEIIDGGIFIIIDEEVK